MENINYLPFYLGCDCLLESEANSKEPNIRKLRSVPFLFGELHAEFGDNTAYGMNEVKLMLRPLTNITEDEMKEFLLIEYNIANTLKRVTISSSGRFLSYETTGFFGNGEYDMTRLSALQTLYLLSKGFDLFGLIEKNVAVDATKLKNVV